MSNPLERLFKPLVDRMMRVELKLKAQPVFLWGTVESDDPVRVRLDGDTEPLAGTPQTVAAVVAGQRVLCVKQGTRVIVLGSGSQARAQFATLSGLSADFESSMAAMEQVLESADERLDEALDAAESAAEVAAAATETALGFARYRVTDDGSGPVYEPELPEDGPRQGAERVWIDEHGHPYRVDVFNGTDWVRAEYLVDQLLVLSPDGTIQIGDGVAVIPRVVGGEFHGGAYYGGEFLQYAAEGGDVVYPESVGGITVADWVGGAPDGLAAASTNNSVYESVAPSASRTRSGAGTVSMLWTNPGTVDRLASSPRQIEVVVRSSTTLTEVHVSTPSGVEEFADIPADTWVTLATDLDDDAALDWVHVGGRTASTGTTTVYVDTLRVRVAALSGTHMRISRNGAGLPGLFAVDSDGNLLAEVTPVGVSSYEPAGTKYARLANGALLVGDNDESSAEIVRYDKDGIYNPVGQHVVESPDGILLDGPVEFQGDVPWTNVTVAGATGTFQYKVSNKRVYVRFDLTFSSAVATGTNVSITPIPSELLPVGMRAVLQAVWGTAYTAEAEMLTNGSLRFTNRTGSSRSTIQGNGEWDIG